MFAAIDEESERIRQARKSKDPAVRASVRGMRPTGLSRKRRILAVAKSAMSDAASPEKRLIDMSPIAGLSFGRRQKGRASTRVQPKLWTPN